MTSKSQKKWLIYLAAKGLGLKVGDSYNTDFIKDLLHKELKLPNCSIIDLNTLLDFIKEYESQK